ncbi:redoxin domain-containing protein [Pelosinus sp. UFO1]|uniref:redoxin domain-containing protein n=1 Tax=Pelosinus sp. UFO1 TaxID=484770 RepID=UPI0004D0B17B|nr:redoxin domain-containing protein [Pelosinus sp. UFO1]AIF49640.1 alkyl hydroperoxide reductase/ Thiol specific antioxidant/ Mal allergen [Pelosinus sp. UFO1]
MRLIAVGDSAPDFVVKDNNEKDIRLSDYRGKKVLLSWHPLAWTPVCAKQMKALEVNFEKFKEANTIPLGFSVDSSPCKKAWSSELNITNVSLPADFWPHGKVAQDYGLFLDKDGFSQRANVLIDENGKVTWVKVYPLEELPDINEVLNILGNPQALK